MVGDGKKMIMPQDITLLPPPSGHYQPKSFFRILSSYLTQRMGKSKKFVCANCALSPSLSVPNMNLIFKKKICWPMLPGDREFGDLRSGLTSPPRSPTELDQPHPGNSHCSQFTNFRSCLRGRGLPLETQFYSQAKTVHHT